uniref:Uncharacterized protein n=1 Tax=Corethrella appendiculata TaxID=1370023 RepID=U5EP70_9DIPT
MESWLVDVKQLRIPRPKFAAMNLSPTHKYRSGPREPPRDYSLEDDFANTQIVDRKLQTQTEELRQALQEKL